MKKYDIIYHLSHNDLDGYGSQYMSRFLRNFGSKIYYFNTNYEQVLENINKVFSIIVEENKKLKRSIKNDSQLEKTILEKPSILFLITDLSINKDWAKKINNFKRGNKDIMLDIQVLDHHESNEEVSKENEWYKYDLYKCGSSMCADFVNTLHNNEDLKTHLTFVGSFIQAHDIWEKESPYFGYSNLLSDIIFNIYFPDFLEDEKREFIYNYIFNFTNTYENMEESIIEETSVENMENKLSLILKNTLFLLSANKEMIEDKNTRSLYKLFYYQAELYSKIKDNFETLIINNLKCKVFYNANSSFYQYFSHYMLEHNEEIDFCINIKESGVCSFRSVRKEANVAQIAALLSDIENQGGGHANAAGCKIIFDIPVHSYDELIKELKNKLIKKGI